MCKILKMTFDSGHILINVSATRELTNATFGLYKFDFLKGEYKEKPDINFEVSNFHMSPESGIYTFKCEMQNNCKLKCVIMQGDKCLTSRERYIGDSHKIELSTETSETGLLYKMKSDISISKKLIFYKTRSSSTKINLPGDLIAGDTLMFTIADRNFKPKFEVEPEFIECFKIEG